MVTTNCTSAVMLWTLNSGRPQGRPRVYSPSGFEDLSLSPDGRTLAVLLPGTGIELVDTTTLRRRAFLTDSEQVRYSAQFTEDGRHIVAQARWLGSHLVGQDRPPRRQDQRGRRRGAAPARHEPRRPDAGDRQHRRHRPSLRFADPSSAGHAASGLPNRPVVPRFTPDGAHLLAIPISGPAYRWDVRPASWARHACDIAGRTLTRAEFSDALPGRDYAPACG